MVCVQRVWSRCKAASELEGPGGRPQRRPPGSRWTGGQYWWQSAWTGTSASQAHDARLRQQASHLSCFTLWLKLGALVSSSAAFYLPNNTTVCASITLIIISFSSPTLSFIPDLKPSFSANHSHCSLFFLLQAWLHDSTDFCCYF